MHEDDNSALRIWRLFEKVMTQYKSKHIVPSQREAVICSGARAQVFKTEVNDILRSATFLFTSRLSVINIFHAKHISGGSQVIKSKGLLPLHHQSHSTTCPKQRVPSIPTSVPGEFCLIICIFEFGTGNPYYRLFSQATASE